MNVVFFNIKVKTAELKGRFVSEALPLDENILLLDLLVVKCICGIFCPVCVFLEIRTVRLTKNADSVYNHNSVLFDRMLYFE